MAELLCEVKKVVREGVNTLIYDAPQLFESNAQVICDAVISVVADREIRINRICKRDNITEEQAELRINAQLSEEFFRKNSDYIIENNDSVEKLEKQAENLIKNVINKR
ncbi:MAG: dephospho-CoA kinase, partial [Ruminococcus sp.]|nr:dephospho-CoA kinase [Ruminococcus sp.]